MANIYDDVEALQAEFEAFKTAFNLTTGQTVATNERFNGKTVYCKTVDIGSLPNATNKLIPSGLTMSDITVVRLEGVARNSGGTTIPIPNPTPSTSYLIGCFITAAGNIQIDTAVDRSDYTGIIRVYYTNNSETTE